MKQNTNRWKALSYLTLGAFLSPLDYFIVNIALPKIGSHFNASNASLQMVVASYGLTYAALVVCGGRFGDIFGRRKMFIYGLYIFLIASTACAFAPSINFLILSRIIQGAGAAMLAPQVLANIRVIFPANEHAKAVGIFGAVFGFAAIMGQLLGGILLKMQPFGFTWQSVFLINIPVAITCILGVSKSLPETKLGTKVKIDYTGIFYIISALICIIYPLVKGREAGWPMWTFITIAIGIVLLFLFLQYETKMEQSNREPLIYASLLKNRAFSLGLTIILIYNFTAGLFICYPYYLQQHLSWSALDTGLAILPYGVGFFLAPLISSKTKIKSVLLAQIGLLLLVLGTVLSAFLFLQVDNPNWLTHLALFIAGSGHGTVMPAMLKNVMTNVTVNQAGQASGIVSTSIQIGSVLGGAIIGSIFFSFVESNTMPQAIAMAIASIGFFQLIGLIISVKYKQLNK